jgi:hypothetical protein
VLLCLAPMAGITGSQTPPQPPAIAGQTNANHKKQTVEQFFLIAHNAAQGDNKTAHNNHADRDDPPGSWGVSDKIALFAGLSAFLQFIALIVTIAVMIKNGHRQLRAYVLPENAGIIDGLMMEPPRPEFMNVPAIGLVIKNTGQTPAHRVASMAQLDVIPMSEQATLTPPEVQERFFSTLGAGTFFTKSLRLPHTLTAEEIDSIANGTHGIFIWGRITYRDAFNKPHCSDFRLHYNGKYPPAKGAVLSFSETGNDSD